MNRSAADFLAYIESLIAAECLANAQATSTSFGISGIRIWISDLSGSTQSCVLPRQSYISNKFEDKSNKSFSFFGWGYLLRKFMEKLANIFKRLLEKWKHK